MSKTKIKLLYHFNFWMGILCNSWIMIIYILFINSSNTIDFEKHYVAYKFFDFNGGSDNQYSELLYLIFYLLFFIFYILFFVKSYYSVNNMGFSLRKVLSKINIFFIGCFILYFTVIIWGGINDNSHIDSDTFSNFKFWIVTLALYFIGLLFCQKIILNYFRFYIWLYIVLYIVPIVVLIVNREMTLLDYQFLFFVNNTDIKSPWLMISLIFSPISYLAMPLFYSFNHYIITKKLVMETSKEEITEDFYKFEYKEIFLILFIIVGLLSSIFFINNKWESRNLDKIYSSEISFENDSNNYTLDVYKNAYKVNEIDQPPKYKGGNDSMIKYIYRNLRYPNFAIESKTEGTVLVEFVVSDVGDLQNERVIKGIKGGCDEEALRIVNSMPKWNSGKKEGKSVPVIYTIPITFRMNQKIDGVK